MTRASGAASRADGRGDGVGSVVELADALGRVIERFEPGEVLARDAVDLVSAFDRIERLAATGKARAAARVAEAERLWRTKGHRSAAHWLAAHTGVGVGDAVKVLDTAQTTRHAPRADQALTRGELSPRQARAIARAETAAPDQGADLLERAATMSVDELETEATRIATAAAAETERERAARHRKARTLTHGTNPDGTGWGRWVLPPAEHARVVAFLEARRDQRFQHARRDGHHEPVHAYLADALVDTVDRAAALNAGTRADPGDGDGDGDGDRADARTGAGTVEGAGAGGNGRWGFAKVIVRVDAAALDRGSLAPGERCEIAGAGPIPVTDAWHMIDHGAFVAAVTTRGTTIDQVIHLGRRPTALQRTALEWMTAGTCAITGCDSTARLEIDHVVDWAASHRTRLRDLAAVCGHHHDLKTHHGHRFGPPGPDGTRPLLPPPAGTIEAATEADGPTDDCRPPPAPDPTTQPGLFDPG